MTLQAGRVGAEHQEAVGDLPAGTEAGGGDGETGALATEATVVANAVEHLGAQRASATEAVMRCEDAEHREAVLDREGAGAMW